MHEIITDPREWVLNWLEDRIDEVKKPINDKIAKIDAQIEALKQESDNENV